MIAVVDYGVGNLYSVQRSLAYIGAESEITSDIAALRRADKILLPGVGAFKDAAEKLKKSGLDKAIIEEAVGGKPLLGICLGMQLLFDKSFEYGEYEGLGLIKGVIKPLFCKNEYNLKIPQMGWNALKLKKQSALTSLISDGDYVYFVHSYSAQECSGSIVATAEYGAEITAVAQNGNVFGTQFHPEKSGAVGLNILRAFDRL